MTKDLPNYRHVIIGGSNKSGTTSLFRYLGDHPDISLCSKKELGFFLKAPGNEQDTYANYLSFFPDASASDYLLEATPTYLDGGNTIARRITSLLDKPRMVFILRDPTQRLISYYRSKHGMQNSAVAGITFDRFLETALDEARQIDPDTPERGKFGWQLIKAHYGHYLKKWLEVFDESDIHVALFDDLSSSPFEVTTSVCRFLGLDPAVYDNYGFSVENKSRKHRSSLLRTLASRTNEMAEPLLNRFPGIRKGLRAGYDSINVAADPRFQLDADIAESLNTYFRPYNAETAEVLTDRFGMSALPDWLA